jgi:hypothetical protein
LEFQTGRLQQFLASRRRGGEDERRAAQ